MQQIEEGFQGLCNMAGKKQKQRRAADEDEEDNEHSKD
jgi:hypothetical protein